MESGEGLLGLSEGNVDGIGVGHVREDIFDIREQG